jgi:hypothetical protein
VAPGYNIQGPRARRPWRVILPLTLLIVFCFDGALMSLYLVWQPFSTAPIEHRASAQEIA